MENLAKAILANVALAACCSASADNGTDMEECLAGDRLLCERMLIDAKLACKEGESSACELGRALLSEGPLRNSPSAQAQESAGGIPGGRGKEQEACGNPASRTNP